VFANIFPKHIKESLDGFVHLRLLLEGIKDPQLDLPRRNSSSGSVFIDVG
jgi:hypothetical protein